MLRLGDCEITHGTTLDGGNGGERVSRALFRGELWTIHNTSGSRGPVQDFQVGGELLVRNPRPTGGAHLGFEACTTSVNG
jgi:hypothetical protein